MTILGHDQAIATFTLARHEGRMPHAWLLAGPRGIGKASLARELAAQLIAPDAAARQRMETGSHGDFLLLTPAEGKKEVTVDEVREVLEFVSLTPNESEKRVVIVDAVDALNLNATNALLKTLEEPPPHAMLLLVSHRPGALLPTIRSRCRRLPIQTPGEAVFQAVLDAAAPDISAADRQALAELSDRAPGEAIRMHRMGAAGFYEDLLRALTPQANPSAQLAFADSVTGKDGAVRWQLLARLLPKALARAERLACRAPLGGEVFPGETALLHAIAAHGNLQARFTYALDLLENTEILNLNARNVAMALLGDAA